MRGDLHCHTKLSDGSLGIEDLITLAKKRGIEVIAHSDCGSVERRVGKEGRSQRSRDQYRQKV